MKATSIFGGVQIFNVVIAVIRSKVIALLLGPTGMGIATLYTSTTALISSLTNFGLGTSAVKDISEAYETNNQDRIAKVAAVFRRLVWVTGLLGTVLTLLLSSWLSVLTFGNKDYTWSFALLSLTLLLKQLISGQNVILQGTRNLRYLAFSNMLAAVLSLVITVPLYYFYALDGIVPALITIGFVSLAISTFFVKKLNISKIAVSTQGILDEGKGMFKLGIFLSLSGLTSSLGAYLIRIYISSIGNVDDVGLYSAGQQIIGHYFGMVFTAMLTDYYPRLCVAANDNSKRNTLVNQQGEVAILILLPIILVFIVFIPLIVELLYSSEFTPINDMIIWSAFGMVFRAGSWAMSIQFLAKASSRLYFLNELSANVSMLILNVIGYKFYGLIGIGYAFVLGYIIYMLQVYFITKYYYNFSLHPSFIKSTFSVIIACVMCLAFSQNTSGLLRYIFCGLLILGGSIFSVYQLNNKTGILSAIKLGKNNKG